ncbi:MAG: hypothetical protein GY754_22710 [bacterium]|nr:hypothetical protein [bacterium]
MKIKMNLSNKKSRNAEKETGKTIITLKKSTKHRGSMEKKQGKKRVIKRLVNEKNPVTEPYPNNTVLSGGLQVFLL